MNIKPRSVVLSDPQGNKHLMHWSEDPATARAVYAQIRDRAGEGERNACLALFGPYGIEKSNTVRFDSDLLKEIKPITRIKA